MARATLKLTQMDNGVIFFHHNDERAFFEWLQRIPSIATVQGEGADGLVVRFKRRPGQDDLRQLLGLFRRYGLDMRQLAKFETPANRAWFRRPDAYWHDAVFGDGSTST